MGNIQMCSFPHCNFPWFPLNLDKNLELGLGYALRNLEGSGSLLTWGSTKRTVATQGRKVKGSNKLPSELLGEQLARSQVTTGTDNWNMWAFLQDPPDITWRGIKWKGIPARDSHTQCRMNCCCPSFTENANPWTCRFNMLSYTCYLLPTMAYPNVVQPSFAAIQGFINFLLLIWLFVNI